MKLLVIYGPPAVGKLTTAKKLSEMTGYCAFHSHLAIDLVSSITPEDSDYVKYSDFLSKIIYDCVKFTWKNGQQGLIMTTTYTGTKKQKKLLKALKKLVVSDGGEMYFVRLNCNVDELKKRVVSPSRDYYGKLMDVNELVKWMSQSNYLYKVDFAEVLDIDNTRLDPEAVAEIIKSRFNL